MERLRSLPARRLESAKRVRVRVNSGSLIVAGTEQLLSEQPSDRRDRRGVDKCDTAILVTGILI